MIWIGITCDFENLPDSRGRPCPRHVLNQEYAQAIRRAGGLPVLLTPGKPGEVQELASKLDGVIISGGDFDVPPDYYHSQKSDKLGALQPQRSTFEKELLIACLQRELPLLGICGGMQLLNVVCGGTLVQDLSLRPNTDEHQQPDNKRIPFHSVSVAPSSKLFELCGVKELQVNSTHHQILGSVPDSMLVSAVAPDGVVEAIEVKAAHFAVGVQWHPECLNSQEQQGIYKGLIRACTTR